MDSILADIAISILIRNAVFHNIADGKVIIEITENTLRISNTGVETPLDAERIFTRFYKAGAPSDTTV